MVAEERHSGTTQRGVDALGLDGRGDEEGPKEKDLDGRGDEEGPKEKERTPTTAMDHIIVRPPLHSHSQREPLHQLRIID